MGREPDAVALDVLARDSHDPIKLPTPGKQTSTGEEWEKQAQGACVRDLNAEGCYLSNAARTALLQQVFSRANTTRTNYKLAASDLKMTTHLQREADFSFLPSLYKEFLTATLLGALTKGVIHLRGGAKDAVEIVTDDAIKNIAKSLGGHGTKRVDGAAKKELGREASNEKAGKLGYLDIVQNDVDAYFDELLLGLSEATDVQLQLFYEALGPAYGNVDILRGKIDERLKRFVASGVLKIGRSWDTAKGEAHKTNMERRVVRINLGGGKEVLFYQHHEQRWGEGRGTDTFGTVRGRNEGSGRTYWGTPVDEQFRTQALAASEAKWGATPLVTLPPDQLRALTGRAQ